MSGVIGHKSKPNIYRLEFPSTENTLSWSFKQEGDDVIYEVELDNIASYTIGYSAITLPYTVKNNAKYSVSIVKTTSGQTASITLKTRRQEQKIITQIVPDFGSNIATHLFAISNTSLYKLDKTLLNQGLNPIIATIPLPIVDSALTIYWQQCVWVNEGGIEGRIYCFGQSVNTLGVSLRYNYSLYVDVATLTVYSYSDVVNSFTKNEIQWNTGRAISTLYDPDEKWVARVSNGIQTDGYYLEYISTNTISAKMNGRKFSSLTNVNGSDATQNVYDYENKVFWRGHGYNFITQLPNILGYFNFSTLWTFIHRNSGTIKAISPDGNLSGRIYSISRDGETIGFTTPSPAVIPSFITAASLNQSSNIIMWSSVTRLIWLNLSDITKNLNRVINSSNLVSGQQGYTQMCYSNMNGSFYATGRTAGLYRIFSFTPDQTNLLTIENYYDMPEYIFGLCTNQII